MFLRKKELSIPQPELAQRGWQTQVRLLLSQVAPGCWAVGQRPQLPPQPSGPHWPGQAGVQRH